MKLDNIFFNLEHYVEKVYVWFVYKSMKANPDDFQFIILGNTGFVTLHITIDSKLRNISMIV